MSVADFALFGRLHPLVLHAPIGFLAAALVLEILATRKALTRPALGAFLWLAALSAVFAATAGWVLAHEDGYGGATLARHQQLGIALSIAAVLSALLHDASGRSALRLGLHRAALVVACVLLVPAGHLGSKLTHGDHWLEGPREPRPPRPIADQEAPSNFEIPQAEPETYADTIAPFLEARCAGCHGEKKKKGGLRLDSPEGMLAGGDSGPALVPGAAAASLLLQRASLPLEHEEHMPPEGKPQPTAEELAALAAWIESGAPFGSARATAAEAARGAPVPEVSRAEPAPPPEPAAPPAAALAALEAAFVHHEPVEAGAHALRIDVAAVAPSFGDAEFRALLVPLAPWIVELGLARSRVGDASLAELARFPVLRALDLRATAVSSAGLAALAGHAALVALNLAQTKLDDAVVEPLLALPALGELELWNAGLSPAALARLRARAGLTVNAGDEPEPEVLEQEGELVFSSERALPGAELVPAALRPVNATCPVSGSPVNPKYVLVHTSASGTRIVGFCCPNCPKEFWADPTQFESKLP